LGHEAVERHPVARCPADASLRTQRLPNQHHTARAGYLLAEAKPALRILLRYRSTDRRHEQSDIDRGNKAARLSAAVRRATGLTWYPIIPLPVCEYAERHFSSRSPAVGPYEQSKRSRRACETIWRRSAGPLWRGLGLSASMTATPHPSLHLLNRRSFVGPGVLAESSRHHRSTPAVDESRGCRPLTSQGDIPSLHNAFSARRLPPHCLYPRLGLRVANSMTIEGPTLACRHVPRPLDLRRHGAWTGMNLVLTDPFPYPEKRWTRAMLSRREGPSARLGTSSGTRDVDGPTASCYLDIPERAPRSRPTSHAHAGHTDKSGSPRAA